MYHKNKNAKSYCGSGKHTSKVDSRAVAWVKSSLPVTKTIDTGKGEEKRKKLFRTEKINEIRNERFHLVLSNINQELLTRHIIVTCLNGK